jgi:hypothetical protein
MLQHLQLTVTKFQVLMSQRVKTRSLFFLVFVINLFSWHVPNYVNQFRLLNMIFQAKLTFCTATAILI